MSKKAMAYLDGGPADGTTVELEHPEWAPIAVLRVDVDGEEVTYRRARQPHPGPGEAWRYVPENSYQERFDDEVGAMDDPYDD